MRTILAILAICAALAAPAAAKDTTVLKAELQAAMQRHIDRNVIDGALPYLDLESGEVTPLYPTEAHPMILTLGEGYVLCADLRTTEGVSRPVDFYMMPAGKRYKIVRTEIDNRPPLKALMQAGKAKRLK